MHSTTQHEFLAATHGRTAHRNTGAVLVLIRRAAAAWRAGNERRIMGQVEPRLLADAGLERFGKAGQD